MSIAEQIKKLQALPEKQKKIVLWTIVAVLAIIMLFFWIKSAANKLEGLQNNDDLIELPDLNIE